MAKENHVHKTNVLPEKTDEARDLDVIAGYGVQFQDFKVRLGEHDGGKLYFGGDIDNALTFVALDENGNYDPSFGVDGVMQPPPNLPSTVLYCMTIHDGMLTVGDGFYIYRVDFNGQLDSNFSVDGVVIAGGGLTSDVIIQPHGLITATALDPMGFFSAMRLNDVGQLDTTFGNQSGWMRFPAGSKPFAKKLFGYANGKVLMVGDYEHGETRTSILAIRTAGFPKPTSRPIGPDGKKIVTVPGTGGNDRIDIWQQGSTTVVNYPEVPGPEYYFEDVGAVVIDSLDGNDRVQCAFVQDPNMEQPVNIDIRSGSGDDEIFYQHLATLDAAMPKFDLGSGRDKLWTFVDNGCSCGPYAFEYCDGDIDHLLEPPCSYENGVDSLLQGLIFQESESHRIWWIEDDLANTRSGGNFAGWEFFAPCPSAPVQQLGLQIWLMR